jgi:2'-5' RNA ligase
VSEPVRCFLAVEIPGEVRRAAGDLIERLRKGAQFTKARPAWVKADNLHYTIVFLGNRMPEQIDRIKTALDPLADAVAPFAVEVGGLGVFPHERGPKVLWIGVRQGGEGFEALYQETVKRLASAIDYRAEKRPYHPHLTLARIKSFRGTKELMDVVRSHKGEGCGEFTASGLTLFRSQLHPAGAIYTPLAHWKFQKQG